MESKYKGGGLGPIILSVSKSWPASQEEFVEMHHKSAEEIGAKEKDFDELIVHHPELLGRLLSAEGVTKPGSKLEVLANHLRLYTEEQSAGVIDVLMAEHVEGVIQRLVIVENKLLKNPESRRTVLAQVMEYLLILCQGRSAADLIDSIHNARATDKAILKERPPGAEVDLEQSEEDIQDILDRGEVLLVIVGDDIQPRAERLARAFDAHAAPNLNFQLALVSLRIFDSTNNRLVAPNLIGTVMTAERSLQITVTVQDDRNNKREATTVASYEETKEHQTKRASDTWTLDEARDQWVEKHGPASWDALLAFTDAAEQAGFSRRQTGNSLPTLSIAASRLGPIKLFNAQFPQGGIADNLHSLLSKHPRRRGTSGRPWRFFVERCRTRAGRVTEVNGSTYARRMRP